ncbi:hypothetical protein [Commensalibacter papalotli (ex Servin-Garciduenas et al. 2014)]|uniref:Uncharacterized protein n=1 Tax=Commensalibacter papalotli (ex Servin-Garciduenas et al. 2014) TaxID=1208583 RepID=W7E7B7_9PROT|nr:hypothetical protein [Commensalibacter papalotli (ex Servin-Garciduenas et al. 2014)]EUK19061.1 hypothetical protein COMX_04905 [Commensalibacter papalotli (ex Servin-Garciduenas et al. 2014)]
MKMLHAYSIDLQKNITATQAHDFYSKLIKSSQNFQCSDEDCRAPVICVNFGKKPGEYKMPVHFRISPKHTENCSIQKDIDEQAKRLSTN